MEIQFSQCKHSIMWWWGFPFGISAFSSVKLSTIWLLTTNINRYAIEFQTIANIIEKVFILVHGTWYMSISIYKTVISVGLKPWALSQIIGFIIIHAFSLYDGSIFLMEQKNICKFESNVDSKFKRKLLSCLYK